MGVTGVSTKYHLIIRGCRWESEHLQPKCVQQETKSTRSAVKAVPEHGMCAGSRRFEHRSISTCPVASIAASASAVNRFQIYDNSHYAFLCTQNFHNFPSVRARGSQSCLPPRVGSSVAKRREREHSGRNFRLREIRILRKSEGTRVFCAAMVPMSAISRTGPLFVVPLSSLCARHAAKSCQRHGRLKSQFRVEPDTRSGRARVLCGLPSSSGSGAGVWFDRTLEAQTCRRRKPLLRWEEQHRWTRAWSGQNLTWNEEQSPYETLGIERDADEDSIKGAYRRMAKQFHPDVYNERNGELKNGETPESYFIQIQAAYELLMNRDQRRQYDLDHRTNPLKASSAWMDWVMKKRKSFDQRGEMAASAWAEQQMRELNLKARRASRNKVDPEEERRILAREKAVTAANFENTIRRQALVLKKRDIMNRKAREEAQKKLVQQLLEAEGLELDDERS